MIIGYLDPWGKLSEAKLKPGSDGEGFAGKFKNYMGAMRWNKPCAP